MAQNPLSVDQTEQPLEQKQPIIQPAKTDQTGKQKLADGFVLFGVWLLTFSIITLAVYLMWKQQRTVQELAVLQAGLAAPQPTQTPTSVVYLAPAEAVLPGFALDGAQSTLVRYSMLHTTIPPRPRESSIEYTVLEGDSVFSIAKDFDLKPETVLWANYAQLQDSPDSLRPGMVLEIPPVNGVLYEWKEGDTLDAIVSEFKAKKESVINFTGNRLDLTNPTFTTGDLVMIPDGSRKFQTWIVPVIARGNAGVSQSVLGPGACTGSYSGLYGGGGFIWPSGNHVLSGNDFWSGHLGIDIAGATGDMVWASDAGVVVFAGWSVGGYGNMVMIDHGNGYQTLYGHLNSVSVGCGQSVYAGNIIGTLGSTGNSTGSHLHFEIRYFGQFVNPWQVLP